MTERTRVDIDMRADGSFVDPPRLPLGQRVLRAVLVIAALAVLVAAGFLFLGLALLAVPAALAAAAVAYGVLRFQLWRAGKSGGAGPTFIVFRR